MQMSRQKIAVFFVFVVSSTFDTHTKKNIFCLFVVVDVVGT